LTYFLKEILYGISFVFFKIFFNEGNKGNTVWDFPQLQWQTNPGKQLSCQQPCAQTLDGTFSARRVALDSSVTGCCAAFSEQQKDTFSERGTRPWKQHGWQSVAGKGETLGTEIGYMIHHAYIYISSFGTGESRCTRCSFS